VFDGRPGGDRHPARAGIPEAYPGLLRGLVLLLGAIAARGGRLGSSCPRGRSGAMPPSSGSPSTSRPSTSRCWQRLSRGLARSTWRTRSSHGAPGASRLRGGARRAGTCWRLWRARSARGRPVGRGPDPPRIRLRSGGAPARLQPRGLLWLRRRSTDCKNKDAKRRDTSPDEHRPETYQTPREDAHPVTRSSCAIGSWSGRCPSLAGYVTVTGATDGASGERRRALMLTTLPHPPEARRHGIRGSRGPSKWGRDREPS